MWKGRFQSTTAPAVQRYTESVSFDWRLYRHDIRGSIAHAAALEKAGILSAQEKSAIEDGLNAICDEIERGQFAFSTELEDVHMNIESALTQRIGPAGAKLHTARSRNDQVALDLRLYLRDTTRSIQFAVRTLQAAFVDVADKNATLILPGYTHLQRAQPVYLAHHLLAYVEMLERDHARLDDAYRRMDVMPLGSGAIAGSTIILDRELIAKLLGFSTITQNSMDAVSDRDFACELLSTLAILGMHLSRFSEDVILWASSEFGFVTVDDAYATGSSLMPQKKNPDVAELTRGKTGRLYGNLFSLLTILKGLPMTYNRDLQEDKEPVFDSVDTIHTTLEVLTGMVSTLRFQSDRMRAAASDAALLATDLADYLVLRGVPFRHAHECIGKLVALTVQRGVSLRELTLADYHAVSEAFAEDVFHVLDLDGSMPRRAGVGAPAPENIAARIAHWKRHLHA